MKFVTVMDMWLLIMNGILLGSILYYGRKLINLVARSVGKQDEKNVEAALAEERKRVLKIIEKEISTFKTAANMGDASYNSVIDELETIRELINK